MARRSPGIRSPSVRTGRTGSAIVGRAKATGIRTPPTQNRQLPMERARKATGNVGTPQQKIRSVGRGGTVTTSQPVGRAGTVTTQKPASIPKAGLAAGRIGQKIAEMGSPAASAVASLARPLKRKPTRGMTSRGSSRR